MREEILLFDINETVLSLGALKPKFTALFGHESYTATWFSMLLHASTVCLTTKVNTNFSSLAKITLETLAAKQGVNLDDNTSKDILNTFANLPAHNDIEPALLLLKKEGFRLVAFSNSSKELLTKQLTHAGLFNYFDDIISVESAQTFKPSPLAYEYAAKHLHVPTNYLRLIACHDWDTHGAISAGLNAAFVDRAGIQYNPLFQKPDISENSMLAVAERIIGS